MEGGWTEEGEGVREVGRKEGWRDGGGFVCWDKASKQRLVGECKEGRGKERRGESRLAANIPYNITASASMLYMPDWEGGCLFGTSAPLRDSLYLCF